MADPTTLGLRTADDTRSHVERINGPRQPAAQETPMTPEQFQELKAMLERLLTPGFELSTLMLAQYQADVARRAAYDQDRSADPAPEAPPAFPPAPPAAGRIGPYASLAEAEADKGDRDVEITVHEDGSASIVEPPAV